MIAASPPGRSVGPNFHISRAREAYKMTATLPSAAATGPAVEQLDAIGNRFDLTGCARLLPSPFSSLRAEPACAQQCGWLLVGVILFYFILFGENNSSVCLGAQGERSGRIFGDTTKRAYVQCGIQIQEEGVKQTGLVNKEGGRRDQAASPTRPIRSGPPGHGVGTFSSSGARGD